MNTIVRKMLLSAFAALGVLLAGGGLSTVPAQQRSEDRVIDQAQRAVRERIITQEGGRNLTVLFNTDAQTDNRSRSEVRVRGTGRFSRTNDSRYSNQRDNDRKSRDFSYEATVNNRTRYGSVSGVTYALRSGWTDYGRDTSRDSNDRDANRRDDDRRDDNARDDNRRDDNRRDDNRRDDNGRNDDRDSNRAGFGAGSRPNGSVSYSGPIMNRHSDKGLDVTERSNRDGADIQQWSYADQPNQNWDVIDLGNGESAIISRQSGRAITVQGGRDNNGANIIQQGWRGSAQQRWRLEQIGGDYYRIVSVDNGKCLDVTAEGRQDGANIQLWDYANQANQQWRLRR